MTRYEELKSKQRAALIVVLTLGLAAVPITLNWNWNSNIFEGTSFDQGALHIVCKIVSFLFLTALFAIPAFFIYLITLIVTTIQLSNMN